METVSYLFAIEDPFEINHNVSRTCNSHGVRKIRDEFRRANRIMRMREGEAVLRNKLFEEAPEAVRPHHQKQSVAGEEHVNGAPENGGGDREGNQLLEGEEGRNKHHNGNGVHTGEGYPELVVAVVGVQKLSVDA